MATFSIGVDVKRPSKRPALAAIVTATVLAALVSAANGIAAATTGLELLPGSRIFDSRQPSSPVTSGVERPLPASPGDIVNVTLAAGARQSWVYFHPCGMPADRTAPAASAAAGDGETWTNMVPIRPSDGCMTLFGDADVIIDLIARQAQPGGSAYVAHPDPVELDVALPASGLVHVDATGGAVPAGADAVAVWATIEATATQPAIASARNCDGTPVFGQTITAQPGGTASNLMLLPIDAGGEICFDVGPARPRSLAIDRWGYVAAGVTATAVGLPFSGFVEQMMSGFTALTPSRAFDTRDAGVPLAGGAVHRHRFTGLPAAATAVALNITVTDTTAPGFVATYPCEGAQPAVSNVNYVGANLTVPNFAIVALGPSRELCFFTLATTHLLVDVSGYFAAGTGDGYVPREPVRVFDTRTSGIAIEPGTTYVADLSAYGARSAVVLNVTVTQPDRPGFVTAYPCDAGAPPTASNLNFAAGQTRPNLVTVRVPTDGRVCFYSSARLHLLADLAGGYSPMSTIGFVQDEPFRVFDTRLPPDDFPINGRQEHYYDLGTVNVRALAWNVTVTAPQEAGFVALYPCATMIPVASNVNYAPAESTANFAIVQPSPEGQVCLYSPATTHLIADEAGYFVDPVPVEVYYEVP